MSKRTSGIPLLALLLALSGCSYSGGTTGSIGIVGKTVNYEATWSASATENPYAVAANAGFTASLE